jgi:hypothetical protein
MTVSLKKIGFSLLLMPGAGTLIAQVAGAELTDPKITGVNTLKPHAWFIPFPDQK